MNGKKEFGDYQTPLEFAQRVCNYLKDNKQLKPDLIIEPTCGKGNFIKSSLIFEAKKLIGIEINANYCKYCEENIKDKRVKIINDDFFSYGLKRITNLEKNILIIGNPPWVTNSTLSTLNSNNTPIKTNYKGLKGIDAITGFSNFDICEYMIDKIIEMQNKTDTVIAMLCKTSVARNIFKEIKRNNISFSEFEILEFDSSKTFGISASACLLYIKLSKDYMSLNSYKVFDFDNHLKEIATVSFFEGNLCNNSNCKDFDFNGSCEFEWRQGIKHDCSKIMELIFEKGKFINGYNNEVNIEDILVFPLIKSSMFKTPVLNSFEKYVIVTQHKVKEDTSYLSKLAPKTWKYLNDNKELFENRKSSIYKGAPKFSMFGIGDYSYSQYKVGVSGFYKKPMFSILYSDDKKPVMTDDTSYFICFDSYETAYVAMLILNSDKVQKFLRCIAFLDSKRPYTKKVLERFSFSKALNIISLNDLAETENKLNLKQIISNKMISSFKSLIESNRPRQLSFAMF